MAPLGQSEPMTTFAPLSTTSRAGHNRFMRSGPTAAAISTEVIGVGHQI